MNAFWASYYKLCMYSIRANELYEAILGSPVTIFYSGAPSFWRWLLYKGKGTHNVFPTILRHFVPCSTTCTLQVALQTLNRKPRTVNPKPASALQLGARQPDSQASIEPREHGRVRDNVAAQLPLHAPETHTINAIKALEA